MESSGPIRHQVFSAFADCFWGFDSSRVVRIRSFRIGTCNRIAQLIVITYVLFYVILAQNGAQKVDFAQSSVTVKVKGVASTLNVTWLPPSARRIWDTPDYVIPSQENGAVFILTNSIFTANQTVGVCAEDLSIMKCDPKNPKERCVEGVAAGDNGHGIMTGRCIISPQNNTQYACEIQAWCPVEVDKRAFSDRPLFPEAINFTIFVKNNIEFPRFGEATKRNNIFKEINNTTYLQNCRNSDKDPNCPIFRLGDMVKRAGGNFTKIAAQGGVIEVVLKWDCNFDLSIDKACSLEYIFRELDDPSAAISPGYNFRYTNYYYLLNGVEARDLIKAYGILFIFSVQGVARKFSIVQLGLNIGSLVGLLGLVHVVIDLSIGLLVLLKRWIPEREVFQRKRYTRLTGQSFKRGMTTLARMSESDTHRPARPPAPPQQLSAANCNGISNPQYGKINMIV